jgi:hypothetical protein
MASYFGQMMRDESGAFSPEKIGGKGVWLFKTQHGAGRGLGRDELRAYARLMRQGLAPPLDPMLRMGYTDQFYDTGREQRYVAAWLLVHFLMHGDKGAHAAGFISFLAHEVREETSPEDLYQEIKMTPAQLQSAFEVYVRDLS